MNVHFKIRYTKYNNRRFDEYVTLGPVPFGSSRVEQLFNYCAVNEIDVTTVIILEDARQKVRVTLMDAYKRWLKGYKL